jgi:hypothetical protein
MKDAFGSPDAGFELAVKGTLTHLRTDRRVRRSHVPLRAALIAAIVFAVGISALAAAPVLAKLGIFDFLRPDAVVLPEAEELIETPEVTQSSGVAVYDVREVLYDGETVKIVVAVTPVDKNTLLIGQESLDDPIANLYGDDGTPIGEYAAARGMTTMSCYVSINHESAGIDYSSVGYKLEGDGTLVYILSAKWSGGEEIVLNYGSAPISANRDLEVGDFTRGTLIVPIVGTENPTRVVEAATVFADLGVRVDKITLTSTPMAMYYRIDYTIIDAEVFDAFEVTGMGASFSFVDEDGESIQGAPVDGRSGRIDGSDTLGECTGGLPPSADFPERVTLRGYEAGSDWGSKSYEAHTFELR